MSFVSPSHLKRKCKIDLKNIQKHEIPKYLLYYFPKMKILFYSNYFVVFEAL